MTQPTTTGRTSKPLRLYFSVGDVSADMHAANLIREIRSLCPDAIIEGMGGPRMAEAGCRIHYPLTTMNIMWFGRVFGLLRRVWRTQRAALRHFEEERPDAVVMLDFPGYNLLFARALAKRRIPVIYYISPQIWAWLPGRIRKIRRRVGKVLCIFPFEEEIYRRAGIPVEYVGHPLFDHLASVPLDEEFCRRLRGESPGPIVGLLPGSRAQEIRALLPAMARAAALVRREMPGASFVVACPGQEQEKLAAGILARCDLPARVVRGRTFEVMKTADLCMVKSGTATMELAHFGTPMIILYRVHIPGYLLGLVLRRTKFIGMVNILSGREAVPERLMWRDDPKGTAAAVLEILRSPERQAEIRRSLADLRAKLDHPGASRKAAAAVIGFAEQYGQVP